MAAFLCIFVAFYNFQNFHTFGSMPSFFRYQNFLESSVEFAYLSFPKDMWLLYRFLKSPSTRPMYLKFLSLSQLFVRQLLSSGHESLFLQLHSFTFEGRLHCDF